MTRLALIALFIAIMFAAGMLFSAAQAQPGCGPRDDLVAQLTEKFGEELRSLGLRPDGSVVEVLASESTGTWTILMSRPDGVSCLMAAGEMWQQDARPLGPKGDPL